MPRQFHQKKAKGRESKQDFRPASAFLARPPGGLENNRSNLRLSVGKAQTRTTPQSTEVRNGTPTSAERVGGQQQQPLSAGKAQTSTMPWSTTAAAQESEAEDGCLVFVVVLSVFLFCLFGRLQAESWSGPDPPRLALLLRFRSLLTRITPSR